MPVPPKTKKTITESEPSLTSSVPSPSTVMSFKKETGQTRVPPVPVLAPTIDKLFPPETIASHTMHPTKIENSIKELQNKHLQKLIENPHSSLKKFLKKSKNN